jgi:hypothetical protein
MSVVDLFQFYKIHALIFFLKINAIILESFLSQKEIQHQVFYLNLTKSLYLRPIESLIL